MKEKLLGKKTLTIAFCNLFRQLYPQIISPRCDLSQDDLVPCPGYTREVCYGRDAGTLGDDGRLPQLKSRAALTPGMVMNSLAVGAD